MGETETHSFIHSLKKVQKIKNGKHILEPVILPCYNYICESHIDPDSAQFDCDYCQESHEVPANGFPVQSSFVKTLAEYLNSNCTSFFQVNNLIENMASTVQRTNQMLKDPKKFVADYFTMINNRIDVE